MLDLRSYDVHGVGAIAASVTVALVSRDKQKSRRSYPPGPEGHSVVGNYFSWPKEKIWEGFTGMDEDHSERGVDLLFGRLLIRVL